MQSINAFLEVAKEVFKERVFTDYLRRFAYGVDASCYRYIPKAVVWAENEQEISTLIKLAKQFDVPLTFRAAGTSLSGQACSDSVLVVCFWREIKVSHNAESIWCDCGVIGIEANNALAPYSKKIGPDPATLASAQIGGIFSNNSSGMCCGVKQNSYNTIKSIRMILSDGSILDTSDTESFEAFCNTHTELISELMELHEEVNVDTELKARIAKKFSIKNTTGYSLNALVDFDNPKDILNHIFIGAEGTLGFVSRVEYEAVPDLQHKACALLFFSDIYAATEAILLFAENEKIISAAEIMDYACLQSVQHLEGVPKEILEIQEGNCAILIQLESQDRETLEKNIADLTPKIEALKTRFAVRFSFDKVEQDSWWLIRKGILPIAAGSRPKGSTVITEDICFFIKDFTKGIAEVMELFEKYHFKGIIFGHALSGNVHFIITPNLNQEQEAKNFALFMEELAHRVAKYQGSIKAEHGTGRMVAPFVELEWGEKAYHIHKRIKKIFDKDNIFNPDVIISEDKAIHTKNLKPSLEHNDAVNALIGKCMECGFCEKHCPTLGFTLTPRQRISVYQEICRLEAKSGLSVQEKEELKSLKEGYTYFGVESCATCSACANLCPLQIDTANIAKLTKIGKSPNTARFVAKNFETLMPIFKTSLNIANATQEISKPFSKTLHQWEKTPIMLDYFPTANPKKEFHNIKNPAATQKVVYFSSCLNRVFAPPKEAEDKRSIQEVFEALCQKAGIEIIYPQNLLGLCCSKAFKDYKESAMQVALKSFEALKEASEDGAIPIVCDHSACALELLERAQEFGVLKNVCLKIEDMPSFVLESVIPNLKITQKQDSIGVYAPCATRHYKHKTNNENAILEIAKLCASDVKVHSGTKCCGFAGNKGFLDPKLNQHALSSFVKFYEKSPITKGYSSSSTCEIGLSANTQKVWQHIIYLLDSCAQKPNI
ncbi:FAD-binding oxidoreductase [Helicobacter sp. MIT 11-5569]|uniref:FAD-binding and (Fe-S)-binding domain-containing protein n=1 Tax=Helicobacter sp. MIT 11-5569 TaxID=1548151 RepID=UPI00051FE28F|nr:FAD-binding and (Fe-S)-binding domain-containing protein [Helicobacter sp. MIT 11-5569]TLD85019.1 FAD-binding oxidoreductase [Helicobacter sp. MIT 11-5569]